MMIEDLIQHLPYIGLILVLLASGFGLPVPEDLPLLLAGYSCGIGHANLGIMLPVAILGVLAGDLIVFALGRRYGHHVPRLPLLNRYLSAARLAKAQHVFHNHGGKTLFMARFMPGLRTPIYFSAGVFKVRYWKMVCVDGVAAILSVPVWVVLGWHFAHDLDQLRVWLLSARWTLIGITVLAVAGVFAWKLLRRRVVASPG